MKKITYYILIISGLLLSQACTDDFADLNTPSDAVTEVNPAYFFQHMLHSVWWNYQRNVNLFDDFYAQYWANAVGSFPSDRYEYRNDWIGNRWNEHYSAMLRRSIAINEQVGEDPLYTNVVAMNEVWTCYSWSRMTDVYGDMPYFGAGEGVSVPYNTQKEIYYDLFSRLDAAVNSMVFDDASQVNIGEYDLIFNGDIEKWQKFGNSLRLRLAMRLSNIEPEKAQAEAQAAIAAGVMTGNDFNAELPTWSKGWGDYLDKMAWDWDNIRISKTFTDYLYNQSSVGEDPRAPKWLAYKVDNESLTREEAGKATYEGLINGYNPTNMPAKRLEKATINMREDAFKGFAGDEGADILIKVPVMYYSEVLFLQAEAALRGWTAGDANDLYKQGIEASMAFVGVSDGDAAAYIGGISDLSGSNEAKLKSIITQKWIANFPNGVEAWADFRRTDYPDITLPVDGVSSSASVAAETYVKRIRYPNNQHELNEASMPAELNTYDKDRMDIRLWWDVADTKQKGSDKLMNSNF